MPQNELLQHANSDVDFYGLLGVSVDATPNDVRRAYRKTALKYHPDKLGDAFDPDKFHLLQVANDVLSDAEAKEAYDTARSARERKRQQAELFEGKRRAMKDELEARERNAAAFGGGGAGLKRRRNGEETDQEKLDREIRRLEEDGRRRRREMEDKLRRAATSTPATPTASRPRPPPPPATPSAVDPTTGLTEEEEEEKIRALEQRIRAAQAAKEQRRAEKKARKSGGFVSSPGALDTPDRQPASRWSGCDACRTIRESGDGDGDGNGGEARCARCREAARQAESRDKAESRRHDGRASVAASTPMASPLANGSKPATPKFSFSPSAAKSNVLSDSFAATMARLKAREKQRLEEEIRRKEAEAETSEA